MSAEQVAAARAEGLRLGREGQDQAGISGWNPACTLDLTVARAFWQGIRDGLAERDAAQQLSLFPHE